MVSSFSAYLCAVYLPVLYHQSHFIRDIQDSGILPKSSQRTIRQFPAAFVLLFFTKFVYIGYAFVITHVCFKYCSRWKVLIGFVVVHFVMSMAEMCIQLPLHINEETVVTEIDEKGVIPNCWYRQMLKGTVDWCERSPIFVYGINTHTIHHMFPGIYRHVHYVALTKYLQILCRNLACLITGVVAGIDEVARESCINLQ